MALYAGLSQFAPPLNLKDALRRDPQRLIFGLFFVPEPEH